MTFYPPSEDSYLLADYVADQDLSGCRALDMGTGSGLIAEKMHEVGAEVVAADVNPEAVEAARERLPSGVEVLESDLFGSVDGSFDLIAFNPPYLPGEEGVGDEEIWRGGETGVETTERFLDAVEDHLADGGEAVVVVSSLADYGELFERFELEKLDFRELWHETLYLARYK